MTGAALLSVEHLTMRFDGLVAIDDLSFAAADREITATTGFGDVNRNVKPWALPALSTNSMTGAGAIQYFLFFSRLQTN